MARRLGILGISAAALLTVSAASAAVPSTLTQQGRLFDSSGAPATGSVSIVFTVYDAASGGTAPGLLRAARRVCERAAD